MIQIGKYNTLKVVRIEDLGMYLADEGGEEVLLLTQYIPENWKLHDEREVFVYKDGEYNVLATTQEPALTLHEFAVLQVRKINGYGAFMNWGLDKTLFVPFGEQSKPMEVGKWHLIYLYQDIEQRLAGSSKVGKFLDQESMDLKVDEEVDLLIYLRTDLGFSVVVNNKFRGLMFHSDVFYNVKIGEKIKGYVQTIRENGKINLTLQPTGFEKEAN